MLVKRGLLWLLFCSVAFYGINGDDLSAEEMEEEIFGRVEEKVLSRKRRYLTFPEGSSLQVVFDQTIPVIGMPLLMTIGVTVAIAYELPSKPWYHYIKDIKQNLKNGAYLLRKDQNASQLTYTDQGHKPDVTLPSLSSFLPGKTNLLNIAQSYGNYKTPSVVAPNLHSYYYKDGPVYQPQTPVVAKPWNRVSGPISSVAAPNSIYYSNPVGSRPPPFGSTKLQPVTNKFGHYFGKTPSEFTKVGNQLSQWMKLLPLFKQNPKKPVYWSDVVKGIKQIASRPKDVIPVGLNQLPKDSQIRYGWKKSGKKPVLPVFGKRSVDDHLNKEKISEEDLDDYESQLDEHLDKLIDQEEEKHFTRHHRKTRHELYSKIETYLTSKGMNGRECVLKLLCETGHKEHSQNLPNSFSAEIIKTIFKLPKKSHGEELTSEVHVAYDHAHHESTRDCADLFPKCEGDLWSHPFLY